VLDIAYAQYRLNGDLVCEGQLNAVTMTAEGVHFNLAVCTIRRSAELDPDMPGVADESNASAPDIVQFVLRSQEEARARLASSQSSARSSRSNSRPSTRIRL